MESRLETRRTPARHRRRWVPLPYVLAVSQTIAVLEWTGSGVVCCVVLCCCVVLFRRSKSFCVFFRDQNGCQGACCYRHERCRESNPPFPHTTHASNIISTSAFRVIPSDGRGNTGSNRTVRAPADRIVRPRFYSTSWWHVAEPPKNTPTTTSIPAVEDDGPVPSRHRRSVVVVPCGVDFVVGIGVFYSILCIV